MADFAFRGGISGAAVLRTFAGEIPCSRLRAFTGFGAVAHRHPCQQRGFTFLEILVVVLVIGLLLALLLPVMNRARAASQSVACLANLRHMVTAVRLYGNDNRQKLPPPSDPGVGTESWENLLRKYLPTPDVFRCAADSVLFDKVGSSYDWRDTGDATTTAAGRYLAELGRGDTVLFFDALPDWHSRGKINAATADGAAQSLGLQECLRDLDRPISP